MITYKCPVCGKEIKNTQYSLFTVCPFCNVKFIVDNYRSDETFSVTDFDESRGEGKEKKKIRVSAAPAVETNVKSKSKKRKIKTVDDVLTPKNGKKKKTGKTK